MLHTKLHIETMFSFSRPKLFALIALLNSFALLAIVAFVNPVYLESTDKNLNPDAIDYGILARNLVYNSCFSRTSDGSPDPLRTPGYPLLIIVSLGVFYPVVLYTVQSLMFASVVYTLTDISGKIGGAVASFFTGIVLVFDSSWYVLSISALTEVSGVFFSLHGLRQLGWPSNMFKKKPIYLVVFASVLLGFSILIRPSYSLYVFVLILFGFWVVLKREETHVWRRVVLAIFLICLFPGLWVIRNYREFQIPKLSTVSTHNMIYFVGAGAYQLANGVDRQDAQMIISKEFEIPTYSELQNPYSVAVQSTIDDLEHKAESKLLSVLGKHAPYLLPSSIIGISKGLSSHAIPDFSHCLGVQWNPPGLKGLFMLNSGAFHVLFRNSWILVALFVLHVFWLSVFLLLLSLGFRECLFRATVEDLSIIAFFLIGLLTIALFGIDAVYRSRVVATVPGSLLCGSGANSLLWFANRYVKFFGRKKVPFNR